MRTRHWYRLAFVALIFAVLSPLFLLNAMGILQPEQGFCFETGFFEQGDPSTQQETESDYFVPPELAIVHEQLLFPPAWSLPVCRRSMRGEHRSHLAAVEGSLKRLAEPNLVRAPIVEPHAQILRVLTQPSFSEYPIALTLIAQPGGYEMRAAYRERRHAVTDAPTVQLHTVVSPQDAEEIWRLGRQIQFGQLGLDGNWLVVEMIERGERKVRHVVIGVQEDSQTRMFCELVKAADVPTAVLQSGDVDRVCA